MLLQPEAEFFWEAKKRGSMPFRIEGVSTSIPAGRYAPGRPEEGPWTSPSTPRPRSCADGCSTSWTSTSTRPRRSSQASRRAATTGAVGRPPVIGRAAGGGARRAGLWNLFLPGEHGAGLTNLQYAPLAEITGRSPHAGPDRAQLRRPGHRQHGGAGRVRHRRSSSEQWLEPLLDGRDPVRVRDDRAGRRLLRRHQHRHPRSTATATST